MKRFQLIKKEELKFTKKTRGILAVLQIVGYCAGAFFCLMVVLAAAACLASQRSLQRNYGIILICAAVLLALSLIFLSLNRRLSASIIALAGWGMTQYVGIQLTNPAVVSALQEIPNDKFLLCHVLPVAVPCFCIAMLVFYRIMKKRHDDIFFMKTAKDQQEKYTSILEDQD